MKNLKHAFFIFLYSFTSFAENGQILKCRVDNPHWKALFQLDTVGVGFLKFKKVSENKSYTCGLKLDYFNDGQKSIVPEITVEFARGSCDPELSASLEKEILANFTLFINLNIKEKPAGRVQWLSREQPESCIVEKLSMFDVQINAKKWIEGKWGRSTASDPKQAPKK